MKQMSDLTIAGKVILKVTKNKKAAEKASGAAGMAATAIAGRLVRTEKKEVSQGVEKAVDQLSDVPGADPEKENVLDLSGGGRPLEVIQGGTDRGGEVVQTVYRTACNANYVQKKIVQKKRDKNKIPQNAGQNTVQNHPQIQKQAVSMDKKQNAASVPKIKENVAEIQKAEKQVRKYLPVQKRSVNGKAGALLYGKGWQTFSASKCLQKQQVKKSESFMSSQYGNRTTGSFKKQGTIGKGSADTVRNGKTAIEKTYHAAKVTSNTGKTVRSAVTTATKTTDVITKTSAAASSAAGTAATAASGGTALPVLLAVRLVRKTFQVVEAPFKRIFRGSSVEELPTEILKGMLGAVFSTLLMPLMIILILGIIVALIVSIAGSMLVGTPLKYIYLSGEELEAVSELEIEMEENNVLDIDNLYQDYQIYMADIIRQLVEYQRDGYIVIYDGIEGTSVPDNYQAVLACLLGTCMSAEGVDDYSVADVLFYTDTAVELFSEIMGEMNYITLDEGHGKAIVTVMFCEDYIQASGCSEETAEYIRNIYAGMSASGSGSGNEIQELPENIEQYCQGLCNLSGIQGTVIQSALAKRGTPYSQVYRDSGNYYDCSSFVYYSYKSAGISMVHGGANTAAAEAQYCTVNGQIISVDDLQPGDLLFYSYVNNGRYKNISHVEMYLGNGLIIDCTETPGVSVRQFTTDRLVLCGRPY